MSEARVARDYDRWLGGPSISGRIYSLLASLPGTIFVNTPAFKLHTDLQLRPEHRLLDIGCGRGALLQLLSTRVRFRTPPVGVDISRVMLKQGKRDQANAALCQAAATTLPFADNSYDVVICAHAVKHLDDNDLLALLGEIRRVLVPGGIALLWELAPTSSNLLNSWNKRVVSFGVAECNLRNYSKLNSYALYAGFDWVSNARLRPFLFPPIPRVSLLLSKAPEGWTPQAR
jgi:SAM-dependent methyltransferase